MRVASPMTFWSNELILSSELISVTTFMNSSSCSRIAFIRSNDCALWIASDPCVVIAERSSRSSGWNGPSRLFSISATPMMSPSAVRIGAHRRLRVV